MSAKIEAKLMPRTEVLNDWFFPSPVRRNGKIVPAPEEAVEKYRNLRDGWLRNHPNLLHEVPLVSLKPGNEANQEGYLVTTEVMYR